jgi:hypothetical protein
VTPSRNAGRLSSLTAAADSADIADLIAGGGHA